MYLNFMSQYNGEASHGFNHVYRFYAIHAMPYPSGCIAVVSLLNDANGSKRINALRMLACFTNENMRAKVKFAFVSAHYTNTMCALFAQHILQIKGK